jgi:RNA-directed DNA polymerase
VVARRLEGKVEPIFHPDSYGYRPGRSALDAVAVCRRRCWRYDWVIDLDVQKFFDSVPWDLVIKRSRRTSTPRSVGWCCM